MADVIDSNHKNGKNSTDNRENNDATSDINRSQDAIYLVNKVEMSQVEIRKMKNLTVCKLIRKRGLYDALKAIFQCIIYQ